MDIAALSMGLSQMKVAQQASISVMKMVMDAGKIQMNDMVQMVQHNTKIMDQSVTPYLGKNIDVRL
ncbi:YjfB family protein [Petroclostridium sp. X23]|uniref:YjfB family protein n=1 Tax=Petroclostridium sp. X23 TaxID=3045146 RepID=UPI0024AD80A0|nr:YjfB family protein [Petroclostridium sp. X23]WHH61513.1 YjfB family protein [Petroclostridium sp. X23]